LTCIARYAILYTGLIFKEDSKMKKISPKMGEVAKVIGKGFGTGLKVGGVAALCFGMAGCESTPAVPKQIISGVIIDSYHGRSTTPGYEGTYYVVDQDGNIETKDDQRMLYIGDAVADKYSGVQPGTSVVFEWDGWSQKNGFSGAGQIISVNKENPH
jgi:hypothetical protein